MTREDIISMAREAGFPFNKYGMLQGDEDGEIEADKMFERFYDLAVLHERESRKAAQLETIALRSELYTRSGIAIKEAYQRGVRDEREACAKVCESIYTNGDGAEGWLEIAAGLIRARRNNQ